MANVPYSEGATDVAPRTDVPDDFQHIQTSPAMFGGLIAQGEEKAAASLNKVGTFYNQVAADDSTNQYMQGVKEILTGTGKPDPVTGQIDTGYYGMKGKDALTARPAVEAKLQDLVKSTRGNLLSPEQQLHFDENTRRFQSLTMMDMGRFADQQSTTYGIDTNNAGYANAISYAALHPEDDVSAQYATHQALTYATRRAQISGEADSPEKLQQIRVKTAQDITEARVKALLPTNAPRAMALLDANRDFMVTAPNYDALSETVKNRYVEQQGLVVGRQALSDAGTNMTKPPGNAANIQDAILQQESGGKNIPNPMQIQPATWSQYAHPGEDINNPDDNKAVGQRIISDLQTKYPDDPARVAVGYFSGPGNVSAPGSVTPWVNNAKDSNGKTVSSYVSDITQRLANASPSVALKANAYDKIMSATDDPQVQRSAIAFVREQYDSAQIAALSDKKAQEDADDKAANGYVTQILKGNTTGVISNIAADTSLKWETKDRLSEIALKHSQSDVDHATQEYGPGFWKAYQSMVNPNAPDRITSQSQILPRAGPGGDLTLPGVAKLMEIMQGKKTPEGEAETRMQSGAFAVIKRSISGEDLLPGLKDPKGEEIFQHALPMLYKAIEQGKAAGIPASELYDPQNKSYIGNAVAPLKRPVGKYFSDMKEQNSETPANDITQLNVQQLADKYFAAKTDAERKIYADEGVRRGFGSAETAAAPAQAKPRIPDVPLAQ